jgi:hypothetical protein
MVYWTLLSILTLCGVGSGLGHRVAEEPVDLIELNHFHDACGRHVYDQVIFYQLAPETGKFRVRAWCLVEDRESISRRPVQDPNTGWVRVEWYDDQQQILRRITSKLYRESWTQVDPERTDKAVWDERSRFSLIQCPRRAEAERMAREREIMAADTESSRSSESTLSEPLLNKPHLILAGSSRR